VSAPPTVSAPPEISPPVDWSATSEPAPSWQPRIAPTPPPRRSKLVPILVVLLVLLPIGAGVGGYFAGAAGSGSDPASAPQQPALSEAQKQRLAANRAKFSADMLPYAEPLLADLHECRADTDEGGPELVKREAQHVRCRMFGVAVHVVKYRTLAERDEVREWWKSENAAQRAFALPGMESPSAKTGAVSKAAGQYVEFAFPAGKEHNACGIWWDRDSTGGAIWFEALCDQIGSWESLRELWRTSS
jgi:hypothetical protein